MPHDDPTNEPAEPGNRPHDATQRSAGGVAIAPAGDTPPDQDSEAPRTAEPPGAAGACDAGTASPKDHPASPGSLH